MTIKSAPPPVQLNGAAGTKGRTRRLPPQLVAWAILLLSFGLFCLLVYVLVSNVSDFLSHTITYKEGKVQAVKDSDANVIVLHRGQPKETLVGDEETVKEGDEIRTDKNSNAVVKFFDDSRIDLAPGSKVRLEEMRIANQNFRSEKRIIVQVLEGSVKFTVAPFVANNAYSRATIKALLPPEMSDELQAQALFNDSQTGNYSDGVFTLSVNPATDNSVRVLLNNNARKAIDVKGNNQAVSLAPGQRLAVEQGKLGVPGLPSDTQVELIVNGSFINGVDSWKPQVDQGPDKGSIEGLIQFGAEKIDDGIQPRTRIVRLDPKADGNFAETSLVQEINQDVSEYEDLWFSIKLRLVYQSLSGGGSQGSEYPVFVKIEYIDRNNQRQEFFYGFYSKAADSRSFVQDQLDRSKKLPQDEWFEFRRNLMNDRNKPQRILRIVVGSAGHLYDSYFTDVSLVAS